MRRRRKNSNDPQEKPDSTQETPAKSTDDEKIVENESSPNSSAAKESIIAAENDQLEETVTERMEFLYIESKELAAPGTQNIVVSWKEAIDDIQNMVLVYENEQGKTFTLKESRRNDESIVFTNGFCCFRSRYIQDQRCRMVYLEMKKSISILMMWKLLHRLK